MKKGKFAWRRFLRRKRPSIERQVALNERAARVYRQRMGITWNTARAQS